MPEFLNIVSQGGVIALVILACWGLKERWWVPGWEHKEVVKERDEWKSLSVRHAHKMGEISDALGAILANDPLPIKAEPKPEWPNLEDLPEGYEPIKAALDTFDQVCEDSKNSLTMRANRARISPSTTPTYPPREEGELLKR